MSQPYLISGQPSAPNPYQPPGPRSSPLFKLVIAVWLLGAIGVVVWRFASGSTKPVEVAPVPATPVQQPATAISTQDLEHHMEAVAAKINDATARLRHAEDFTARAMPAVERNYLLVERRQLEAALAATEAARRDLEQSRQDADLILNSLKKEHELK